MNVLYILCIIHLIVGKNSLNEYIHLCNDEDFSKISQNQNFFEPHDLKPVETVLIDSQVLGSEVGADQPVKEDLRFVKQNLAGKTLKYY